MTMSGLVRELDALAIHVRNELQHGDLTQQCNGTAEPFFLQTNPWSKS